MPMILDQEEQAAWDTFANTAFSVVLSGSPTRGDVAADVAAKFADALIEERRKRQQSRPE